ncbi:hypothetical protein Tco_0068280 [Tanacetum coccineum]
MVVLDSCPKHNMVAYLEKSEGNEEFHEIIDFHTINHSLSSKSTSWDQIPTNIATAVICLTSNQKYNFSKLIFDGKQLANVPVPLDHFSRKVTPLFASMLVQPTEDEGAPSERPSKA